MIFSIDLKERVVAAINEDKMRLDQAIKVFKVARRTIYNWLKKYQETGDLKSKINYQKGYGHKITNLDSFKIFVEKNKESTVAEMAYKWEELTNEKVSKSTVLRRIKRIGFTYKKKLLNITKQAKKKENNF